MTVDTAGFSLVTFPDVPEAGPDAETHEEALGAAPDALIAALGGYIAARRPLPLPSLAGALGPGHGGPPSARGGQAGPL